MKTIKKHGTNIQQMIEEFKVEHGLDELDFGYEVIQEPKKGFLGFIGNKKAILMFKISTVTEEIQDYIKEFSIYAHVTIENVTVKNEEKYIMVDLNGVSDPGFLIGKDGKFLQSLQYLLNQTFAAKDPRNRAIIIDVEGYKERQENVMIKKIQTIAAQVIKSKKNHTLDPMSASQRRIVHQALKEIKDIKTMTIGEGTMKRVVLCHSKTFQQQKKKQPTKPNAKRPTKKAEGTDTEARGKS